LNNGLIKSLDFAPIALAVGQGRNTQYEAFPWPYYPISDGSDQDNDVAQIITKNLHPVRFEYAGSIDTLRNGIRKTVLLSSAEQSQVLSLPAAVSLADIELPLEPEEYRAGRLPLAVLAQGEFTSAYRNKVKPFDYAGHLDTGKPGNILLIADGDVLKNQVDRGQPQDLGYDMRTGMLYGNKEFLLNTIELMLDGEGLIGLRNKDITVPFLNLEESYGNRSFWQLLNLVGPLVVLCILGFGFVRFRKRINSV
jgi:gliding-associated putative ABC transporter substrate-binding component GldG